VEYDNNDLLGEVLDIWHEEAAEAEELRRKAEAAQFPDELCNLFFISF
jgi:protein SFI1